jgi:uncharacterized membrane protein YhaH (DUF805 family)
MFDAIKKYAVFSGRAARKEYWLFVLLFLMLYAISLVLDLIVGTFHAPSGLGLLNSLVILGLVIPAIATTVRRLHDLNWSGWWYLLTFIPFASLVFFVAFIFRGTVGPNRFGPDPLAEEASS